MFENLSMVKAWLMTIESVRSVLGFAFILLPLHKSSDLVFIIHYKKKKLTEKLHLRFKLYLA